MNDKSITKRVIDLSIPNSLQQLLRLLTAFILTLMVARVSTKDLAALALGYILYLNFLLFITGINYAVSILVAKSYGSSDNNAITDVLSQIAWTSILLSIPSFFLLHYGYYILVLFGQNPQLAAVTQTYLNGLTWGILPFVLSTALTQFLLGLGRARILNLFAASGLVIATFCAYALIFGHFGMPRLGLAGAGYALSISVTINLIFKLIYIRKNAITAKYINLKKIFPINFKIIKNIIIIGFPISLNMLTEILAFSILIFIIGTVNHMALAAYQVVSQLMYIPLMFPFAISQACAVLTSQSLGAGSTKDVTKITQVSAIVAIIPVACASLLFWVMPTSLVKIFLQEHHANAASIIHLAGQMLIITGFFQLIETLRLIGIGTLRGLKDVKAPLYFSLISFWLVDISIAVFIAFVLHGGVIWIWLFAGIGTVLGFLLVYWRLRQKPELQFP